MLKLKLKTDPRWVALAENNLQEAMTDHAYCEQKAASNAISIMVNNPQHIDLAKRMSELAREELTHYEMVLEQIEKRGFTLGRERKDSYVNELYQFCKRFPTQERLVSRLLFAAMVEARSCERFRVLSEHVEDQELADFYHELMISEAGHYTLFLKLAKQYANGVDVDARWQQWLDFEGKVIESYGTSETIHG